MGDPLITTAINRRSLGGLAVSAAAALTCPAIGIAAEPKILRLASIQPLTGSSASFGIRNRNGTALAIEELNEKGLTIGGETYRIELSASDMAAEARQAVNLFRQYAADPGILAVFGPNSSLGFIPLVPVAGQLECPLIECGAAAPIKEWNTWSFRINPIATTATPAFVRAVVAKEKIKRLAVLFDQTQDGQKADADMVKAIAPEIGYEVAAFEAFRTGDQDLSPQIASIRRRNPDAIFVAGAGPETIRAVNQVREIGMEQPLLAGWAVFQDTIVWDNTRGLVKGGYTWLAQDLLHPSPALSTFIERYRQKFADEPSTFSVHAANGAALVAEALVRSGATTRAHLRETLASIKFDTPLGASIAFQNPPSGENVSSTSIVVAQITGRGVYDRV